MISRGVKTFIDNFDRAQAFTTTPGMNGWTIKDTSSAGTPTYLCITEDGGAAKLTLVSTSEAEIVTLFQNDVLMYDVRQLKAVWWIAKVAGIDAVTTLTMGVGSIKAIQTTRLRQTLGSEWKARSARPQLLRKLTMQSSTMTTRRLALPSAVRTRSS